MRKIEAEMQNAVALRQPWQKNNTTVVVTTGEDPECKWSTSPYVSVHLHGNRIAYQPKDNLKVLCIDRLTLKQYPTRTTLSRLRALGFVLTITRGKINVIKDEVLFYF